MVVPFLSMSRHLWSKLLIMAMNAVIYTVRYQRQSVVIHLFNRSPHLRVHSAIDSITRILAKTLHELHIGRGFLLDLYRAQERVDRRRCTRFGLPTLQTRQ